MIHVVKCFTNLFSHIIDSNNKMISELVAKRINNYVQIHSMFLVIVIISILLKANHYMVNNINNLINIITKYNLYEIIWLKGIVNVCR